MYCKDNQSNSSSNFVANLKADFCLLIEAFDGNTASAVNKLCSKYSLEETEVREQLQNGDSAPQS